MTVGVAARIFMTGHLNIPELLLFQLSVWRQLRFRAKTHFTFIVFKDFLDFVSIFDVWKTQVHKKAMCINILQNSIHLWMGYGVLHIGCFSCNNAIFLTD